METDTSKIPDFVLKKLNPVFDFGIDKQMFIEVYEISRARDNAVIRIYKVFSDGSLIFYENENNELDSPMKFILNHEPKIIHLDKNDFKKISVLFENLLLTYSDNYYVREAKGGVYYVFKWPYNHNISYKIFDALEPELATTLYEFATR